MVKTITIKELKPVLMEKSGPFVKMPYYLIEDSNQVIYVVSAGKNGNEFNKTTGYVCTFPGMQTYTCLYGAGLLLMQRNDETNEAKEFKVVAFSSLKTAIVPAGWSMCLVNTGINLLVVLRNSALEDKFRDQKPIMEKGGLAYFVVEKKGEIVFEQNFKYKAHPQIAME